MSKTVLITGCSIGGIGYALAEEFHRRGLHVIATARRLEAMQGLTEQGIQTLKLDVTDEDSVRASRDATAKLTNGKLDILVNNAGTTYSASPATDFEIERANALFDANVFGPMRMVKHFIGLLIASGNGRILQISSVAAIVPVPFMSVYNASKAALDAYSNTLRIELSPFNIKVITVLSGAVSTNMVRPSSIPPDSIYHPIDDIYQARRAEDKEGRTDPKKFAMTLAAEALSSRPSTSLWAGSYASVLWFINALFGRRFFDFMLPRQFGLNNLAAMVKSNKVKTA